MRKLGAWKWCIALGLLAVVIAVAQPPAGPRFRLPGGGPASFTALSGMPEVQKELKVTPEQLKTLDEAREKVQQQNGDIFRDFRPMGGDDVPPEEREKRFEEVRIKSDKIFAEGEAAIRKTLSPEQMKRLEQLQLQREGALAFNREEVRKQLAITPEQEEKLRDVQGDGFGPPRFDPESLDDALKILSDEQKSKWKELAGNEIKFPEFQPFGPGGFGPPGGGGPGGRGPGGPGGFGGQDRKILKDYDTNSDGWLNNDERKIAREKLKSEPNRGGGRGPGGPGGRGPGGPGGGPPGMGRREPGKPGPKIPKSSVAPVQGELYDTKVFRTLFLDFENSDWEKELEEFHGTDVDVTGTLTVDGKEYKDVGVHFRGMSSYGMVPNGSKRSLNVSLDLADEKQRLGGYKTLNLLNCNGDPTFMSSVLYSHIAREHIAAPKANFVRVVINGESWGVYANVQQFDKIFAKENFGAKAARWKVSGSPGGGGGLVYLGDNSQDYKRRYEIKSSDDEKSWQALIKLCKTLKDTPPDQLEAALRPMLDIEGTLWFLALDCALINSDGYWIRDSDYSIAMDEKGIFHIVPHDMNEAFHAAGGGPGGGGPGGGRGGRGGGERGPGGPGERGPGGGRPEGEPRGPGGPEGPPPGGPRGAGGGGGFALDPLVALNDSRKPLRSKLLQVPSLKAKYLEYVREIAEDSLDWKKLAPTIEGYKTLIADEVKADTRKLATYEDFERSVSPQSGEANNARGRSLQTFAVERRKYLLDYPAIKELK